LSALESAQALVGRVLVGLVRRGHQRKLGARVREHRDRRGRVTPYLELGRARRGTLVWLHGFSDRFETFLPAAAHLHEDFRIVIPSMPGFGKGWVDHAERHTFGRYADWMGEVLGDVVGERFHVMGNSLGGATALALGARMPERLHSVTAVNSAGLRLAGVRCIGDEVLAGENLFEVRSRGDHERLNRRVFARPMKLPRPVVLHLYREALAKADWHARLMADLAQSEGVPSGEGGTAHVDLGAVRVPTLVLWGDRDSLFPVAHGEHVAQRVAQGRFERLEGVGHCPHLESPRRLAEAFSRFAASLEG
jgi:abhydrolase domain-containing protein 6